MTSNNEQERKLGICKWFDKMKGFGFIQEIYTTNDFFVHYSQLQSDNEYTSKYLVAGEYISFVETEYSNPTEDNMIEKNTRTAGSVSGVGGGPLMYQTQLLQQSFYQNEKQKRHRANQRHKQYISNRKTDTTSTSTQETEISNPFSLLDAE